MNKAEMLRLRDKLADEYEEDHFEDYRDSYSFARGWDARDQVERPEVTKLVEALTEIAQGRTHPEGSSYSGTRSPTAKQCASKALAEYRKARE